MATSTPWQLQHEAAQRYAAILVPTILGPFAQVLVGAAQVRPGELVVDVGCGTGAAARGAAEASGPRGRVLGVDINAALLAVARSHPAEDGAPITWQEGAADQLPVPDQTIDVVLCAQTLQFLPDRAVALTEMRRVLKPGGRVAVSVWCPLDWKRTPTSTRWWRQSPSTSGRTRPGA